MIMIIIYSAFLPWWTKNIRLFIREELTEKEKIEVNILGIEVIENDDVTEIIDDGKGLIKGVISKSKRTFDADVIFYHLEHKIQNKITKELGCEHDEGYVKVNAIQQTTVSKVYATGDIDTDRHYIVLAAASGALAAISIYKEMLKDAIGAVKKRALKGNLISICCFLYVDILTYYFQSRIIS